MKLTVLGNNGPYPAAGSACSGYLLQSGTTNVLIDCGNGVLSNMQKIISIDKLDAVILTHLHSDHMSDMYVLKYAIQLRRKRGLYDKLLRVYAPAEPSEEYERLDVKDAFELGAITDDTQLAIGDIKFSFLRMKHPYTDYAVSAECAGKKFVYSGDTSWTDGLVTFAKGADLLMLDAGFLEKDWAEGAPHMTAAQCGKAAAMAGAKKLLLTHIWPDYDLKDVAEEAAANFPNAEAAMVMKEYEI
ncbi:MAG TPA: MBL fold metallo-hydrolase [Clostridia bacterium]